MLRAYTLRAPYQDTLTGGVVTTGRDGGDLDIVKALEDGDGVIKTDDNVLQAVLESYYGADGLVFDTAIVLDDGSLEEVKTPEVEAPQRAAAVPPVPDIQPEAGDKSVPNHLDSGYSGLTTHELQEIANERELPFDDDDDDETLIQLLEEHDEEGADTNA